MSCKSIIFILLFEVPIWCAEDAFCSRVMPAYFNFVMNLFSSGIYYLEYQNTVELALGEHVNSCKGSRGEV